MDKDEQSEVFSPVLYCLRQSHLDHPQTDTSPTMQRFVEQLVAHHGFRWDTPTLNLQFVHPARNERLLIGVPHAGAVMVARMVWAQEHWWENPLMIFGVDATTWVPEEIRYSPQLWTAYVQVVEANNALTIYDEYGQPLLASLTEYMAVQLTADDWLAQGQVQEATAVEEPSTTWQTEKNEGIVDSESAIWD